MKVKYLIAVLLWFGVSLSVNSSEFMARSVKDDVVVIVKRAEFIAMFSLNSQTTMKNQVQYTWDMRNGAGKLESGQGIAGDFKHDWVPFFVKLVPIEFGPFRFYWSTKTRGEGWVYFNYYPGFHEELGAIEWCVSSIEEVKIIDLGTYNCDWESTGKS